MKIIVRLIISTIAVLVTDLLLSGVSLGDMSETHGLLTALLVAAVLGLLNALLKPVLIGEKTKLPVFLLFLGMLGGLKIYGLTGIFLGPVILSLFFVLVKIYHEEYQTRA